MALSIHALAGHHSRTRLRETAGPSAGDDFAALVDGHTATDGRAGDRRLPDRELHLDPLQGPMLPHIDPPQGFTKPHGDPLESLLPHLDPLGDRSALHIDPLEGSAKPHGDRREGLATAHVDPPENLVSHADPLEGLVRLHGDRWQPPVPPHVDPLEGLATAHIDPMSEVARADDKARDRVVAAMHEAMTRFTSMSALLRLGQGIDKA